MKSVYKEVTTDSSAVGLQETLAGTASSSAASAAMTMGEHITELRRRILISAAVLIAAIVAAFTVSLEGIEMLKAMAPETVEFVQLAPGEVLMASLRLSLYMGIALASPVILYQTLRFVLPGLKIQEKWMVLWAVLGGSLLFAGGCLFAYFLVIPSALTFLVDYGQSVAAMQMSIESYIGFCASLLLVTGGMFELPMALFVLSFTRLVTSQMLIAEWRRATVIIFLVSAIVTPSQDPLSMGLVGLAMVMLYALSIIPIRLCGR